MRNNNITATNMMMCCGMQMNVCMDVFRVCHKA